MRKSELVAKLNAIDGDPEVVVDVDGVLSDDIQPSLRIASEEMIAKFHQRSKRPAVGDPVILI